MAKIKAEIKSYKKLNASVKSLANFMMNHSGFYITNYSPYGGWEPTSAGVSQDFTHEGNKYTISFEEYEPVSDGNIILVNGYISKINEDEEIEKEFNVTNKLFKVHDGKFILTADADDYNSVYDLNVTILPERTSEDTTSGYITSDLLHKNSSIILQVPYSDLSKYTPHNVLHAIKEIKPVNSQSIYAVSTKPGEEGNSYKVQFTRTAQFDVLIEIYNGDTKIGHTTVNESSSTALYELNDLELTPDIETEETTLPINDYIYFTKFIDDSNTSIRLRNIVEQIDDVYIAQLENGNDDDHSMYLLKELCAYDYPMDVNNVKNEINTKLMAFELVPNIRVVHDVDEYVWYEEIRYAKPLTNFPEIPVTLQMQTNSTSTDLLPYTLLYDESSSYHNDVRIGGIPMLPAQNESHSEDVQYLLRTSSFTIIHTGYDYDLPDPVERTEIIDAYYKIGILPLENKQTTLASIVNTLKQNNVFFISSIPELDRPSRFDKMMLYPIYNPGEMPELFYMLGKNESSSTLVANNVMVDELTSTLPYSIITPLYEVNETNPSFNLKALIYFQLCKTDGTPIDTLYTQWDKSLFLETFNEPTSESLDNYTHNDEIKTLSITDENISSGFIVSPNAYPLPEPESFILYLNTDHTDSPIAPTTDTSTPQFNSLLYNENTSVEFNPMHTYKLIGVYDENNNKITLPQNCKFELGDNNDNLGLLFYSDDSKITVAAYVKYTESIEEMTAFFNPGINNIEKSATNSWGSTGGQHETLYPMNSSKTIPFVASTSYTITSVFYTNMQNPVTIENPSTITIDQLNYAGNPVGHLMLHTHTNNPVSGKPCGCTFTANYK